MIDQDDDRPLIRNEDTLRRRAWIDRALSGVRQRLIPADPAGETAAAPPAEAPPPATAEAATPARPRLYLVRGDDPR